MDQVDPWQVVFRQVYTVYSRLLISTAFVVSRVVCLGVTGAIYVLYDCLLIYFATFILKSKRSAWPNFCCNL